MHTLLKAIHTLSYCTKFCRLFQEEIRSRKPKSPPFGGQKGPDFEKMGFPVPVKYIIMWLSLLVSHPKVLKMGQHIVQNKGMTPKREKMRHVKETEDAPE